MFTQKCLSFKILGGRNLMSRFSKVVSRDLTIRDFKRTEVISKSDIVDGNYRFKDDEPVCVLSLNKIFLKRILSLDFKFNFIIKEDSLKLVIPKEDKLKVIGVLCDVSTSRGTSTFYELMNSPGKTKFFYVLNSDLSSIAETLEDSNSRFIAFANTCLETLVAIKKRDLDKVKCNLPEIPSSIGRNSVYRHLLNVIKEEAIYEEERCLRYAN